MRDGFGEKALRELRGIGTLLLSRGVGGGFIEHRDLWVSQSQEPRLRDLSREGVAIDEHSARRAHGRGARPHLPATIRIGAVQGDRTGNFKFRILGSISSFGRKRGGTGQSFLPARPRDIAAGGSTVDGGGKPDGRGVLAVAGEIGAATVQCLWPETDTAQQGAKAIADFSFLVPVYSGRDFPELWLCLKHLRCGHR